MINRSKIGTKRHILTDKKGIPLSAVISPANTHDIDLVIDVIDNAAIKREQIERRTRIRRQHLCLDKGYNSTQEEQELIKRGGYVLILVPKERRVKKKIPGYNIILLKPEKTLCKKMGRIYKGQTHGITGFGNSLQGMKRLLRII